MNWKLHVAVAFVSVKILVCSLMAHSQVSLFHPPSFAGSSASAFVADFNGDTKPDILTGDGTMNLGNGDGTFTQGTAVTGGALAVADFNGDGNADVLQQGTGTLLVLLGKGDGTFQAPISSPSNASLSLLSVTDLNGDGKADVVGMFNNALLVYTGKGDGTFAPGVSYDLGSSSAGATLLALGDFNGDGKSDAALITAGSLVPGQILVFVGNGDGTLQAPAKISTGVYYPRYAVTGDFNADGKLDFALGSDGFCNGGPSCPVLPTVFVLKGNGDGTFQAPVVAIPNEGPIFAADVNGDGEVDLIFEGDPTVAQIYLGNGDGTFSNISNYVLALPPNGYFYPGPSSITSGDFNGDGRVDIAVAGQLLLGEGNGKFQGIPLSVTPSAVAAAVIGVMDKSSSLPGVAAVQNQGDSLYILKNNGDASLSLSHTYTMQLPGYQIFAADLNADGNLDLLVLNRDGTTNQAGYSFLLGNGDGSFQSPTFYPLSIAGAAVLADLNHDNKLDLVIDENNQTVGILLGNGDGTFALPVSYFTGGYGILVVADFNGDDNLDIASSAGTYPPTAFLYGNGDGTFQPAVFPPALSSFGPDFTADLNNDGKADLIGTQVAMGNGNGTFTLVPLPSSNGVSFGVNEIADLNGDAKPDMIATTSFGSHDRETALLLGNGDGTFGPRINVPTGFLPISLIADMSNDGRPDLIFFWSTSAVSGIGVELNTTPPGFELSASTLLPPTVTAGSSTSSTLTVVPTFGFTGSVALSISGLPSGASYTFNPPTIANSSGTSVLTISTTASAAQGTYSVQVQGTAGSAFNSVAVSLVVQAPPGFALSASSGSPTSQTISAGQTASFSLDVAPSGSFTGTVNLSCAITPVATMGQPACVLSSSSVQITGTAQTVTVKVTTTGSVTTASAAYLGSPPGPILGTWMLLLLVSGWLLLRNRRRLPILAAPAIALAFASWIGCGGSGTHTRSGTPAGTYTATVTAVSGSLSSNMTLQVIVQ
jgi:hypothetical protein